MLFAAAAACGGDPFVLGDASVGGQTTDAAPDAPVDAPPPNVIVRCPTSSTCSRQAMPAQSCCTSTTATSSSNCTGGSCSCLTQLECANDSNCTVAMPVCCIGQRTDSGCMSGHFYAQCRIGCLSGETRLCDPNASHCPATKPTCSSDSGDLQAVGLPSGYNYGICKQ